MEAATPTPDAFSAKSSLLGLGLVEEFCCHTQVRTKSGVLVYFLGL
jgi:hypothetical protein